jgi:hypothetical protein
MKRKAMRKALERLPVESVVLAMDVVAEKLWERQLVMPPKSLLKAVLLTAEFCAREETGRPFGEPERQHGGRAAAEAPADSDEALIAWAARTHRQARAGVLLQRQSSPPQADC